MIRISLRFACVCFAVGVAAGCISTGGDYPLSWPDRVRSDSDSCPDVNGEYRDLGEKFVQTQSGEPAAPYVYREASLIRTLHLLADKNDWEPSGKYQTVRLQLAGQGLQVTAVGSAGNRSLSLPIKRECRDSMMRIARSARGGTLELVPSVGWTSLTLGRAMDGALIVEETNNMAFGLVFPMRDREWQKFTQVETSEPMRH